MQRGITPTFLFGAMPLAFMEMTRNRAKWMGNFMKNDEKRFFVSDLLTKEEKCVIITS